MSVDVTSVIDEMITEEKKHMHPRRPGGRLICWLCYEQDYCEHEIRIEILESLKKRIT